MRTPWAVGRPVVPSRTAVRTASPSDARRRADPGSRRGCGEAVAEQARAARRSQGPGRLGHDQSLQRPVDHETRTALHRRGVSPAVVDPGSVVGERGEPEGQHRIRPDQPFGALRARLDHDPARRSRPVGRRDGGTVGPVHDVLVVHDRDAAPLADLTADGDECQLSRAPLLHDRTDHRRAPGGGSAADSGRSACTRPPANIRCTLGPGGKGRTPIRACPSAARPGAGGPSGTPSATARAAARRRRGSGLDADKSGQCLSRAGNEDLGTFDPVLRRRRTARAGDGAVVVHHRRLLPPVLSLPACRAATTADQGATPSSYGRHIQDVGPFPSCAAQRGDGPGTAGVAGPGPPN